MSHYVFTLKFLTPVHFGNAHSGGKLEKAGYVCAADTLFSALCVEADRQGAEKAAGFIEKFRQGRLSISSLYPYYRQDEVSELELYLPKPFVYAKKQSGELPGLAEMKVQATAAKKEKKALFVRASEIKGLYAGSLEALQQRDFVAPALSVKVNCRGEQPLPYYVGSYLFARGAGLYFVAYAAYEEDLRELQALTEFLGYSGVGGKRSSGYGKFSFFDDVFELDGKSEICGKDDLVLAQMLDDKVSSCQMCIAPLYPVCEALDKVKAGTYKLLKRSGFVDGIAADNIKRQSIYMLAEGSCFQERLPGSMMQLRAAGAGHPVYRNGLGMFVGL